MEMNLAKRKARRSRRDENESPVRQWEVYNPIVVSGLEQVMKQVDPNAPTPPPNRGIRFVAESR